MSVTVIIPARYASTRYPGKPLVALTGATGVSRSLVARSWDCAKEAQGIDRIVVATDDARIEAHCREIGAEVIMTPESCRNGTERCAAAAAQMGLGADEIVVNLQGDAPLTPPWFIDALVADMVAGAEVATPVLRLDAPSLKSFREDRMAGRVGGTTAVFDRAMRALYFSKEVVPYTGRDFAEGEEIPVFHHVGVYAYRPPALEAYAGMPAGPLETWEGLEQLRFMENGIPLTCTLVDARGRLFWELNNPVDVARIEAVLKAQGQA